MYQNCLAAGFDDDDQIKRRDNDVIEHRVLSSPSYTVYSNEYSHHEACAVFHVGSTVASLVSFMMIAPVDANSKDNMLEE